MSRNRSYTDESAAVQAHLKISQSIILRMSANSSSCKTWCITILAAILVVLADKGNPNYALIAFVPTILFLILDAYYLALERCFRESYNLFIDKLHNGQITASDLYSVGPSKSYLKPVLKSFLSFSIWPFYLTLGVMILLSARFIISNP